ncbi:L-fucose:H+ symporter permease [Vibrio renipiscarius]|uniref:Fucose permease n=1 Tax=Vibrio renipiscarius TaxID=1461322 RepID=A0A0C2K3E7_9VIBR|nr:L-fucose:H+ symporter permease [Vibrio renipiscarius]KII76478.1 fucose permease [Vibrio renipiscarius]KII78000.1 fucose permease [Vibrio renipiscarius]
MESVSRNNTTSNEVENVGAELDTSCYLPKTPWVKFILVCLVFSVWGIAASLNDVLIPQFRKGFELSDTQSALVQSVFFFGYFAFALPAATIVKKYSYKTAIVVGLSLYALGCFMFIPAANTMTYVAFLGCLLIISSGLAFLETSCNTYSTLMGDIGTSTQRLNFSQVFNSVGVFLGIFIGQQLVFSKSDASHEELIAMAPEVANAIRMEMVEQVVSPYIYMGIFLLVLAVIFAFVKFPACRPQETQAEEKVDVKASIARLFQIPHFRKGLMTQFLYVGAQVGIWSFTIRFAQMMYQGLTEHAAANYLMAGLVIYAVGKAIATVMMKRIEPSKLLGIYGIINFVLITFAALNPSEISLFAVIASNLFMSPMFPTTYGLCIKGLGKDTSFAGSLVVMTIGGGAVVPPLMGLMSDSLGGNMQLAFILPALCFAYIGYYGIYCNKRGL